MFRFFPSVLALQLVLAATVAGALYSKEPIAYAAIGVFVILTSVLFSIWLRSISELQGKDEIARHKDAFAKEREEILVSAEKEKLKVVKASQKQFNKDTSRANAKANFKVGAAVAAAVGIGAVLVISQLVTLGLLTLTTAGGGLAGYLMRARQDRELLPPSKKNSKRKFLNKPKVINALGKDQQNS
jgi:hypothetical protein